MSEPLLSILICHIYERAGMLASLLRNLEEQIEKNDAQDLVEILVCADNRERTTGAKRNELLEKAKGKFLIAIDEDDRVPPYYIEEILKGAVTDCDAMAMSGEMRTDGANKKDFFISKDHKYCKAMNLQGEEIYLRYNNHISPILRTIAQQFKFPDKVFGEDFAWSTQIYESGLIQKEYKIERHPLYFYDFISNK